MPDSSAPSAKIFTESSATVFMSFPRSRCQQCARLFKPFKRSDLVESLLHFKPRQLPVCDQPLVDHGQIEGLLVVLPGLECRGGQDAQPVVDMVHPGFHRSFVVADDTAAIELDVAAVPAIVVP